MEEDIRHMLMKSGLGVPPPPSLDIVIMQKIKAEQDRRIYRKVVVHTVLKVLALFALLVITGVVLWWQAGRLDWAGAGDRITSAGLWIKENVYFVLGGMIAVIFAGVFRLGRA
ncbi:hypothetical protein ACQ86N_00680 [Puia sp. P3]|uniref:hypothetical protein n=1 Tax=Puia sp. P3 TaxID=3423952 RepID=UPI003D66FF08